MENPGKMDDLKVQLFDKMLNYDKMLQCGWINAINHP